MGKNEKVVAFLKTKSLSQIAVFLKGDYQQPFENVAPDRTCQPADPNYYGSLRDRIHNGENSIKMPVGNHTKIEFHRRTSVEQWDADEIRG